MRAQDRWNKKAGYISKSYKVNQNIADDFASSCKEWEVSRIWRVAKIYERIYKEELERRKENESND